MNDFIVNETLNRKLCRIPETPLTAMEAPAGYGKTTFLHSILDDLNEPVYWYTAVETVPDTSFRWFVRQLAQIDEVASEKLTDLGFLNRSNASEAAHIISEIRISSPVTLVFDNFQFSVKNWQPQILESLSRQPQGGLRTVFLSQNFADLRPILLDLEESICFIRGGDLLLSEDDIKNFVDTMDLEICADSIHQIFCKTEGWAAAVSLFLSNVTKEDLTDPSFSYDSIGSLMERILWRKLSPEQKDFLLHICLLDKISLEDANELFPEQAYTEEALDSLLCRIPLIRHQAVRRAWYPHEILLRFLRGKLEEDKAYQREVFLKSGQIYERNGMLKDAFQCYFQAKSYEEIWKLQLFGMLSEDFDGISYTQAVREILDETPEETQSKYPLSLLRFCYALYGGCAFREFEEQMERAKDIIEARHDPQLLGEWHMVHALAFFPRVVEMDREYRLAEELMERPSEIFVKEEPFMFGCTSMWYLFYTEQGEMMEIADRFSEMMIRYNHLTNDHGSGAAELYLGEALSVQGRYEESDIQAYQAAFLSEQASNSTVSYGASLLLGINAIYTSDMISLEKAIAYLENKARGYGFLRGKTLNTNMLDTVRGYLLGLMMETSRSASWTQGDADSLTDLTFTTFMIKTCRITDLLLKKEYKQAIASVETSLLMDERLISVPTRNFMYCGLALCYMAIGRLLKASEYLGKSLELAGKDKNYTFLACFRKYFSVLFKMPRIAARYGDTIREIKALRINYTRVDESRIFSMLEEEKMEDLTDREREVAELAAKGYRNQEIAQRLFISENTVKHHLKIIFQKMNIDRRSKLVEMLR